MSSFIPHKLRESLENWYFPESSLLKESLILSKNAIAKFVKIGLNSIYDDEDMALTDLKEHVKLLNSLPNPVKLYRVVFLENENQLNRDNPGSHYVMNRQLLEKTHSTQAHLGAKGKPYMLTVLAPLILIDVNETLSARMQYPHESEITLKNEGKGAKILSLEPMSGEDEFDFDF